jgi:hypothetical protein
MKRTLLSLVSVIALALAVPGIASAHHGSHHAKASHHHKRHHRAHHARVRMEHFRPTTANTTDPTQTPTGPQDAGTVASFTGGVLTLTLADGSTVSGKVTDRTEIECKPAPPIAPPTAQTSDHHGDNQGSDDNGDQGNTQSGDDHQSGSDDENDDDNPAPQPVCDATALVAGAVVHEATLRIDSSGATFKQVQLVK